ncbi:Carboxylesterase 5A [Mactra antiquata]
MMEIYLFLIITLLGITKTFTQVTVSINVQTPVGEIIGVRESFLFDGQTYMIRKFIGIPYAESERFTKPVKKNPFSEPFTAKYPGKPCIQNIKMEPGLSVIPSSEDCLSLNIYMPDTTSQNNSKAVMIFIYGGSFQIGSQDWYASNALPALNDVIYVTFNYRVGVHGFLASKLHGLYGNYGLWDQHMAIKWVHDNIESFGGDPNRVTLFGESAGSASVMYQALYPGNKGMFNRIILESGVVGTYWSYQDNNEDLFNNVRNVTGCDRGSLYDVVSCMQSEDVDVNEADSASPAVSKMYLPVQDNDFINYDPADLFNKGNPSSEQALSHFADFDVIIGVNSHEGVMDLLDFGEQMGINVDNLDKGLDLESFNTYIDYLNYAANFTQNEAVKNSIVHEYTDWTQPNDDIARRTSVLDLLSDIQFIVPAILAGNAHSLKSTDRNTYMYRFDQSPSYSVSPEWVSGADHAEEIGFVLGFPQVFMYVSGVQSGDPASTLPRNEVELSKSMMEFWTRFAKFGNPNSEGEPNVWPEYNTEEQHFLILKADENPLPIEEHFRDKYVDYWSNVYPRIVKKIRTTNIYCVTDTAVSKWQTLSSFLLFVSVLTSLLVSW